MATEPITFGYITAKTVKLAIRRDADGFWFDFNDTTFKNAAWTTSEQAMTELSGAAVPVLVVGQYRTTVDPAAWNDGTYQAYVLDTAITTYPVGTVGFVVSNGTIVADARLDAAVTTRLAPTTASRTLDVTATGAAGIDWGNIENPTTAVNLSGTNIDVDQIVASVSGAVGSVTGNVTGSIGSLATQAKADVNAEVLDVLNVDTFAEPGQGAPAATASLVAKIGYLFKAWRNKLTQTATTLSLYDDAGTTVDQKSTVSDDGTTFTRGEIATGP